jgi:Uma2 family endonuclease
VSGFHPISAIEKYKMLPEGASCEVLYNQIVNTAKPNTKHQLISAKLSALLFNLLDEKNIGVVLRAPTDVHLQVQESIVQPDIFIIIHGNKSIIHPDGIYGTPDIIFEILCGNRKYDTHTKKALYEDAGVKEYFIVDPLDNTIIMFAFNKDNQYEVIYESKGRITSAILGVSFNL